jgi:hypothetical protein
MRLKASRLRWSGVGEGVAPSSSTLISGPTEEILIDALLTFENADQIAAWAKRFGKSPPCAAADPAGADTRSAPRRTEQELTSERSLSTQEPARREAAVQYQCGRGPPANRPSL